MSLPPPLLQSIEREEWVPFLGCSPDRDMPTPADLADFLAEELDSRPEGRLPQVAQDYAVTFGTPALRRKAIQFFRQRYAEPASVHHLLARLPLRLVLTTARHDLLEKALQRAGRHVNVIVTKDDLAFYDESSVNVLKLWGDASRPETLKLTEKELLLLFDSSPLLNDVILAVLATRTLVFLGMDLTEPSIRQLIFRVTRLQGRTRRRAYALWPPSASPPEESDRKLWEEEQVVILNGTPAWFLFDVDRALAAKPAKAPEKPRPAPPIPRRPFKFLDSYTAGDAPIFFGREKETGLLTQKVLAHRMVVLTGPLGVGKTSLVQAGLLPTLEDRKWHVVTVRVLGEPAAAIRTALSAVGVSPPKDASIATMIAEAEKATEGRLVLSFDPFEEVFSTTEISRQTLARGLAEALERQDADARFLLVLRGDYLMRLTEFGNELPEAMHNVFTLRSFTPEQAVKAITEPLRVVGIQMEDGLAMEIAEDLKDEDGYILPSQLQIVADRLYDDLIASGKKVITHADYARLGGAEEVLRQYLGELLERTPHARPVIETLVGEKGRRLAREVQAITQLTGLAEDTVQETLEALQEGRVVTPLKTEGHLCWELNHDILAQTLWQWLGEDAQEKARALAVLERAAADHSASGALPDPRRLDFVAARWTFLPELPEEFRALLLEAAVVHGHRVSDWLNRLGDPDLLRKVLLPLSKSDDPSVRARSLSLLAEKLPDVALGILPDHAVEDPDRAVRRTAALAWYDLAGETAWNSLRKSGAVQALADLWDADRVDTRTGLSAGLPVLLKFAHLRLQTDSPRWQRRVLTATLGGGLGMALGTSLAAVLKEQLFIAAIMFPLGAIFGLLAGLGVGAGFALGDALRFGNRRIARTAGGVALGGIATALAGGAILWFSTPRGSWSPVWMLGWLVIGIGVGVGLGIPDSWEVRSAGATVGGTLGGLLASLLGVFAWPVGLAFGIFVSIALWVFETKRLEEG